MMTTRTLRRHDPGVPSRLAGLVALLVVLLAPNALLAQERAQRVPEKFPDLVTGLKATPGCLGVETARTQGGKQVIFAWFRDKAAALRWYNSDMHREAQSRFFPNRPEHKPLADVPDNVPILTIASLTWADSAQFAQTKLPISQIAIELYQPLPGGVFLGSRFAPDSVLVKGMLDYTSLPKKN